MRALQIDVLARVWLSYQGVEYQCRVPVTVSITPSFVDLLRRIRDVWLSSQSTIYNVDILPGSGEVILSFVNGFQPKLVSVRNGKQELTNEEIAEILKEAAPFVPVRIIDYVRIFELLSSKIPIRFLFAIEDHAVADYKLTIEAEMTNDTLEQMWDYYQSLQAGIHDTAQEWD